MTHHITDEQIDATSADELLLKVYELLWGEHPECCGNPEAVGYFGDSPAIDCCRCPNYARLNDAQIVASLRALIKESDLMSLLGMRSAKTTPLADWSVDVFDDDEEGRTYINIRNPDDDVAAAGVNTYVVGNRRTLASQVLRGFHQAFRAALTAAPTPPAQTTPEPVGGPWGWAIEDKHGVAQAIRPARKEFFGCVQSTEPFTAEDIAKMDREWVGIAPHRIVTLHTRPAEQPAVPEDVARVNKQMLEALEDVLANCLDSEGLANAYKKARAALSSRQVQPADSGNAYGWSVSGTSFVFRGTHAEYDAKQEAKRVGGTCVAFPLYTASPAVQPVQAETVEPVEFEREQRYLVFKLTDLQKHLEPSDLFNLQQIGRTVASGREQDGKTPLECVVVESDWPEYEPTWRAIEQRVSGTPAPAQAVPDGWIAASDCVPLESDGEVFVRFKDGSIGTGWATYWHGASNEFAEWTFPDPDEDRAVSHWMKPPAMLSASPAAASQEGGE